MLIDRCGPHNQQTGVHQQGVAAASLARVCPPNEYRARNTGCSHSRLCEPLDTPATTAKASPLCAVARRAHRSNPAEGSVENCPQNAVGKAHVPNRHPTAHRATASSNQHHGRGLNTHAGLCDQSPNPAPSRASTNLQRTGAKPLVSSASIISSLGSLPFKMNGKVARYRSPRSSASRGGRMPRNPRADQIGTGGRIKSESPGGCARNAQYTSKLTPESTKTHALTWASERRQTSLRFKRYMHFPGRYVNVFRPTHLVGPFEHTGNFTFRVRFHRCFRWECVFGGSMRSNFWCQPVSQYFWAWLHHVSRVLFSCPCLL